MKRFANLEAEENFFCLSPIELINIFAFAGVRRSLMTDKEFPLFAR